MTPWTVRMTVHYTTEDGSYESAGERWSGANTSLDWHTYAIDWRSDRIAWLIDGVERWEYTDEQYIAHQPMYVLLNLAVGGDYPGPPDAKTVFPSYFDVDYVRVWSPAQ